MRAMITTFAVAFVLALATPTLAGETKKDADDAAKGAVEKEMSAKQPPAKSGETVETTGKREESKQEPAPVDAGEKSRQ